MLNPGDSLQNGRYRIVRRIAQTRQSTVYEANALNLNTQVALKEVYVSLPQLRGALRKEAQRLAILRHMFLPKLLDYFDKGNLQYLVMEYVPGNNLAEQLNRQGHPFSIPDVLAWADQLLEVLTYLHSQEPPVIHRDIKPANIKLASDNKIILLDFGIAKGGLPGDPNTLVYAYTPGYAPPEQMRSNPTNERSDIYAVGATFYHLVTGNVPPNAQERERAVGRRDPDPLRPANQFNPQVPVAIAEVLAKAMALDPNERPASAVEMGAMLKQAHEQSQETGAPLPPKPPSNQKQKPNAQWIALAAGIALFVLVLVAVILPLLVPPPITFTVKCSNGITDTVSVGGSITLATDDSVYIKPSRMPANAEASDGILKLQGQEYSYDEVPTDTKRVNIDFIFVNENTNELRTTLFLRVVPSPGGLCYPEPLE